MPCSLHELPIRQRWSNLNLLEHSFLFHTFSHSFFISFLFIFYSSVPFYRMTLPYSTFPIIWQTFNEVISTFLLYISKNLEMFRFLHSIMYASHSLLSETRCWIHEYFQHVHHIRLSYMQLSSCLIPSARFFSTSMFTKYMLTVDNTVLFLNIIFKSTLTRYPSMVV